MLEYLASPTFIGKDRRIVAPNGVRLPSYQHEAGFAGIRDRKKYVRGQEISDKAEARRKKNALGIKYISQLRSRRAKAGLRPKNGFKGYRMPTPEEVTVSRRFVKETHPLYKYIAKQDGPLDAKDFEEILTGNFINLKIPMYSTGAIAASAGDDHQAGWTRDKAAIALGWEAIGDYQSSSLVAQCLYRACSTPSQREKINRYLEPLSPEERRGMWMPESGDALKWVPHVKFKINDMKELVDNEEPWGMQQLDAFGYKLLLLSKLLDKNLIDLQAIDGKNDPEQKSESTVIALARMLKNLEIWNDIPDLGAWENLMHEGRLSSVAAAYSGLVGIRDFVKKYENDEAKLPLKLNSEVNPGYGIKNFLAEMDDAIEKTSRVIKKRIRFSKGVHEVENDRHFDAALAFILILSDADKIGLGRKQKLAVLRSVYSLIGETGFRRFNYDPYEGKNWIDNPLSKEHNPKGETSDMSDPEYRSAEWAMFDPYLATINYKLFEESIRLNNIHGSNIDFDSYYRADMHMRRSMAAVSPQDYEYVRLKEDGSKLKVEVPKGEVQEAWWYSKPDPKKRGLWLPGENWGLNWTKVAKQHAYTIGYIVSNKFDDFVQKSSELPASFGSTGYYDPLEALSQAA